LELVQHVAELWASLRQFSSASEKVARRHGLTPQQYRLLLLTKGAPKGGQVATVGELTEQLCVAQSSVTELIDRAEAAGLVTRRDGTTDARTTDVRLTPEGERRLNAAVADLTSHRRRFTRLISELRNLV
jgi:DNA-binding MarR family transcriptional regulator